MKKTKNNKQSNKVKITFLSFINKKKWFFIAFLILILFYAVLYKIYIPRINAFGCFDDCNNFMGGYFLLHGKRLFSEIFFNHNPFMAYISWAVQLLSNPSNIYELILRHRQTLFLFSFLFNLVLLFRFGLPALVFTIFYELTKFYFFGDRFLAESFIVYPLVYLTGIAWYKWHKKPLYLFDYFFAAILTWFILFMREPYVPVALILFGYLLWDKKEKNRSFIACLAFGILSVVTVVLHDIPEFYFNVVTTNIGTNFASEAESIGISGMGFFRIFFYPVVLFFGGEWGHLRYVQVFLSILFLVSSLFLVYKKQWKLVICIWFLLGLANIRYVDPGLAFYRAFHVLCWFALFLFTSFLMLWEIQKNNKQIFYILGAAYGCILLFHIFSPSSFIQSKPYPHEELITNYGIPMQTGTVINILSEPSDTLFLDGFDDIIYWQSKRFSNYKYSWYTSLMPSFKKYKDERVRMFRDSPPDFYYGSCPKEKHPESLIPTFVSHEYVRLFNDNKPSCLWVHIAKIPTITDKQWKRAEESHYFLKKSIGDTNSD